MLSVAECQLLDQKVVKSSSKLRSAHEVKEHKLLLFK